MKKEENKKFINMDVVEKFQDIIRKLRYYEKFWFERKCENFYIFLLELNI